MEVSMNNGCICSGDTVTYECTVVGDNGGITVWMGDFFVVQMADEKYYCFIVTLLVDKEEESTVLKFATMGMQWEGLSEPKMVTTHSNSMLL